MTSESKNNTPKYYYKYRGIKYKPSEPTIEKKIEGCYSIKSLMESTIAFSSRKAFNDVFDSKFEIIRPTAAEIKQIGENNVLPQLKSEFKSLFNKGKITQKGMSLLDKLEIEFNKEVDKYAFLCLSESCNSNLMWAHYATDHTGFCLEFNSDKIQARKVTYQDELKKIHLIDWLKAYLTSNYETEKKNGLEIWNGLTTKLKEWSYEEEYRFQTGDRTIEESISKGQKYYLAAYNESYINSIIFGIRTPEPVKQYITDNLPYKTKFKQARPTKSGSIVIEPLQPQK